jgi:hypothetical protein
MHLKPLRRQAASVVQRLCSRRRAAKDEPCTGTGRPQGGSVAESGNVLDAHPIRLRRAQLQKGRSADGSAMDWHPAVDVKSLQARSGSWCWKAQSDDRPWARSRNHEAGSGAEHRFASITCPARYHQPTSRSCGSRQEHLARQRLRQMTTSSVKYEEVCQRGYDSVSEARTSAVTTTSATVADRT